MVLDTTQEVNIPQNGEMINLLKRTDIEIHKIDATQKYPLEGAVFGLYDREINLISKKMTDHQGKLVFAKLECGLYYIKEIKAPKDYIRNEELYPIELVGENLENLNVMKMVIENDATLSVDYPETGRQIRNKFSFEFIVVAFGIYILRVFLKKES